MHPFPGKSEGRRPLSQKVGDLRVPASIHPYFSLYIMARDDFISAHGYISQCCMFAVYSKN